MSFRTELKEFLMRGSVVDMAVGIVIGGAFGKIVTSFVNDILMPPIALLVGDSKFTELNVVLKQAIMEGMITLRQDGLAKVKAGITTISEVLRVT